MDIWMGGWMGVPLVDDLVGGTELAEGLLRQLGDVVRRAGLQGRQNTHKNTERGDELVPP
jgi:hypothetical protein